MGLLLNLIFPLVPAVVIVVIVLYGPIRNRWWRRETPIGFALFIGTISFMIGFAGPMVVAPGANQGPLLGVFYTGPIGLVVGLVWGIVRAVGRKNRDK